MKLRDMFVGARIDDGDALRTVTGIFVEDESYDSLEQVRPEHLDQVVVELDGEFSCPLSVVRDSGA